MNKEINLDLLRAPFGQQDIEWRAQRSGIKNGKGWVQVIPYIDNRAVQNRLDDVAGPENWRDEFDTSPNGGILCGLSIRINGEWITKWDGADNSDIEPIKGGLSNAMKRAAVQWGIGRYLYSLESSYQPVYQAQGENFIQIWADPKNKKGTKPEITGFWNPPQLPDWAKPIRVSEPAKPTAQSIITGTASEVVEREIENPASVAQLIKIKSLWLKAGGDDIAKRDEWLKTIKTSDQAEQAIKVLNRKIEDKENEKQLNAQ